MRLTITLLTVTLTIIELSAILLSSRYIGRRVDLWLPILWRSRWTAFWLISPWYYVITGHLPMGPKVYPLSWVAFGLKIQIVFVIFFYFFYLLGTLYFTSNNPISEKIETMSDTGMFYSFAIVLFILSASSMHLSTAQNLSYGEASTFFVARLNSSLMNRLSVLGFFKQFYWPVIGYVLIATKERSDRSKSDRLLFMLSLASGVISLYFTLVYGQRTALFESMLVVVIVIFFKRMNRKVLTTGVAILALLVLVVSPILSSYRSKAFLGDYRSAQADFLLQTASSQLGKSGYLESAIETIVARSDAYRNGGALAKYAERHGFAGFRPFEGLIYFYIPRFLMPNKPVIGSENGLYSGMPAYIMGWWGTPSETSPGQSASRSVAGEAYWQFGWFGCELTGLVLGLFTAWCGASLLRGSNERAGVLLYLCIDPGGNIAMLIYHKLLRGLLFLYLMMLVVSLFKGSDRNRYSIYDKYEFFDDSGLV